jgi:hypothetical protein
MQHERTLKLLHYFGAGAGAPPPQESIQIKGRPQWNDTYASTWDEIAHAVGNSDDICSVRRRIVMHANELMGTHLPVRTAYEIAVRKSIVEGRWQTSGSLEQVLIVDVWMIIDELYPNLPEEQKIEIYRKAEGPNAQPRDNNEWKSAWHYSVQTAHDSLLGGGGGGEAAHEGSAQ